MKFYVISIILNIGILLIPVIQPIAGEIKEEILTVNLENFELSEDDTDTIGGNEDMGGSGGDGGSGGSSRKVEKQTALQSLEIAQNMQTKENNSKTTKNSKVRSSDNTEKTTPGLDKETKISNSDETSEAAAASAGRGYGKGSGDGTGTGHGKGDGSGIGNGKGKGLGDGAGDGNGSSSKKRSYGCVRGKGYKITSSSKIKRTKANILEIPDGTSVNVSLTFNLNGSVTVHGASGSNNSKAKELAIQAAEKMKITVIDKEIVKCKITNTYNFI